MKILVFVGLLSVLMFSCTKNVEDFDAGKNKVEFGTVALKCVSDCIKMYKLEGGDIFSRKSPVRFLEDLQYDNAPLPAENTNKIISLLNSIPDEILESEENYGCPGCVDEPFIYLIFTFEEKERKIKIDTKEYAIKGEVKQWVKSFLAELNQLP
jgi:hypothetical protein